jgi:replicative DNA helicase
MNNLENIRSLVLCSILRAHVYNNVDLNVVMSSGISVAWFDDAGHCALFEVMKVLYDGGKEFDDAIIMSYMEKSGVKDAQGVMLSVMAHSSVPHSLVMEYIVLLREHHAKKLLNDLNATITKMLSDENSSSDAITAMIQNSIDKYVIFNNISSTRRLSDVRIDRKNKELTTPVKRLKTGIPFIDTVLTDKKGDSGIRNEGLFFISGLKQSGKTFVLTRLIENISKEHPVMFGSMEFGEDLYDENIEQQQNEGHFEGNIDNIYTFDSIYEVNAICAEIRLMHKLHGIKIAALDSMMRMTNANPDLKTDERRISETFSKLGKLSKELKIPIIVVVQSSKEDLKSSMISVKGSMNADHEAYVWFHLTKTKSKDAEDEMRSVIWNKNKDTHKHPAQTLMFVPQTSDFYRVELDEHGNAGKALDKFRRPPAKAIEIVYETKALDVSALDDEPSYDMPTFF